ncbi:unnamed protein product [Clavelina lepadiformis]|uniref:Resistance to inhibitors of cholinesterase protein 3 N-terminal domain-containing protein n=1 Tax=Clavelina lepadiformis TaxID=159417 RepID=A0ABP0GQX3_CLALP
MTLKTQLIIAGAGAALFVAFLVPMLSQRSKPNAVVPPVEKPPHSKRGENSRRTVTHSGQKPEVKKSSRSWLATLAPAYTVAVLGYVAYIIYKIMKKKHTRNITIDPPNHNRGGREKQKTKLTKYELDQLETKLMESEKVVEKILEKARIAFVEGYKQDLIESSLSESSDNEEAKIVESDWCSTSSANNDSHQDSSSSSDHEVVLHHRKTHHRTNRSLEEDDSSSSFDEGESGIHPRSSFTSLSAKDQRSRSSLADEYISTNHDQSEFDESDDDSSEEGEIKAIALGKDKNLLLASQATGAIPAENSRQVDVETLGGVESTKSMGDCVEQNKYLVETSQKVLQEMEHLKEYLKEVKQD